MSFPKRPLRFLKSLRNKLTGDIEPASTISLDRPLSAEEHALVKYLLESGGPKAIDFLPQLDCVHVNGQCDCGCPTIDLDVPTSTPPAFDPTTEYAFSVSNLLVDCQGKVDEKLVGIILWQGRGYLSGLEIYPLSEIEPPYGLPDISTIEPVKFP